MSPFLCSLSVSCFVVSLSLSVRALSPSLASRRSLSLSLSLSLPLYMCMYTHGQIYVYIYTYTHIYVHMCIYVCIYVYRCMYISIHVCTASIYICIYTYSTGIYKYPSTPSHTLSLSLCLSLSLSFVLFLPQASMAAPAVPSQPMQTYTQGGSAYPSAMFVRLAHGLAELRVSLPWLRQVPSSGTVRGGAPAGASQHSEFLCRPWSCSCCMRSNRPVRRHRPCRAGMLLRHDGAVLFRAAVQRRAPSSAVIQGAGGKCKLS